MNKIKVAYFGGSFDPVHEGHLAIIKYLITRYDKVCVVPSFNYTKGDAKYSFDLRLKSLIDLCKEFNNVSVLKIEPEIAMSTYKTVLYLKKQVFDANVSVDLDIVVGSDCLKTISNWHYFNELKKYHFVVIKRDENGDQLAELNAEYIDLGVNNISSTDIRINNRIELIPQSIRGLFV